MTSNNNQPQPKWPEPIVLVARIGKGCKQYTFATLDDFKAWTARKPYCGEHLMVIPIHAKRILAREVMPAADAHDFAAKLLGDAKRHEENATVLANAVLRQAEERDRQCAFWFVSALSKLHSARPDMRVADVLKFASDAMPAAAEDWVAYIAGTV